MLIKTKMAINCSVRINFFMKFIFGLSGSLEENLRRINKNFIKTSQIMTFKVFNYEKKS